MLALIQRVTDAQVDINSNTIARILTGILAFICVEDKDNITHFEKMAHKLLKQRIFEDENGKMNKSLIDIKGGLLLVPQFTLVANTDRGLRPSFSNACPPQLAKQKFEFFCAFLQQQYDQIQQGQFGANMQVTLINDGPVTLWLKV
ncbi:D-aminoacyl-tRNA deacylase [Fastidiosibacter lacustris]|uniref:D-aminoacyl-tRNA deacylase n=1 Tax=Fastidiosibacter lacustris TaxID=2056695 RepID=UPI000E348367|nr:D-aminoacyl-tRNA deacylase [Fastidiosibacter lacustris]